MGCECAKSRPISLEAEHTVQTYEDFLGFSSLSCSKFTQILGQITTSPHLSRSQLEELIARAELRACPLGNQEHPVAKLYAWLKVESHWSAAKLITLSLVLSSEKPESKVTILLNAYAAEPYLELNEDKLQEWLRDICLIALKLIPEMTEGLLQEETLVSDAAQVTNYRKKLESGMEDCIAFLTSKVMNASRKSISKSELIEKSQLIPELFSSRCLRELSLSLWKSRKLPQFQYNKSQKQHTVDTMLAK